MAKTTVDAPYADHGYFKAVKVSGSYGRKRLELDFEQIGGVEDNEITVKYEVDARSGFFRKGPFKFSDRLSKSHIVTGSVDSVAVWVKSSNPESKSYAKVIVDATLKDA